MVAEARNECDTLHDPTAHAEMVAFRRAGAVLASPDNAAGEMRGATLYSTLQPCRACAPWPRSGAKVGRVVYGAGRDDVHAMYFEARHVDTIAFIADAYRDDISIEGGVLREACAALYHGPDDAVSESEQGNL